MFSENSDSAARLLVEPQNITQLLGSVAVLECAAAGIPRPTITWTRQGRV